jgi:hypothetical protein
VTAVASEIAMAALSGPRPGQRVIATITNAIGASIATDNSIASNSVMALALTAVDR